MSHHTHERMSALQLMVQLVELVQAQLGVDRFLLVSLVQKLHLEENRALTVRLNHAISGRD